MNSQCQSSCSTCTLMTHHGLSSPHRQCLPAFPLPRILVSAPEGTRPLPSCGTVFYLRIYSYCVSIKSMTTYIWKLIILKRKSDLCCVHHNCLVILSIKQASILIFSQDAFSGSIKNANRGNNLQLFLLTTVYSQLSAVMVGAGSMDNPQNVKKACNLNYRLRRLE